jgi:hypothetical protein
MRGSARKKIIPVPLFLGRRSGSQEVFEYRLRKLVAFRTAATGLLGIIVSSRDFLKATAVARRQQRLIGIAFNAEKNLAAEHGIVVEGFS